METSPNVTYTPGDILLVRNTNARGSLVSNLILAGNRAKYGDHDCARWTHAAIIVSSVGNLVEALSEGVSKTHISKYDANEKVIVSPHADPILRAYSVRFALAQVGEPYGYVDFVSDALSLLFRNDFSFHLNRRPICSELVARSTECNTDHGYDQSAEEMLPSDLAFFWKATSDLPPDPIPLVGRLLDKFRAVLWALLPWKKGLFT